jgi:hypothetical protein
MASSELGDLKTPKFNGTRSEDFQIWALRVEAIMSAKGILDVLLPAETGAEGAQDAVADGDESEGEGGQAGLIDGNAAMRRSKAVAIIVLSLEVRPLRAVVGVRGDPREMWRRLHVRYAGASSSTKVSLHETVANKRLKKGGNMLNHIAEFEQLYETGLDGRCCGRRSTSGYLASESWLGV